MWRCNSFVVFLTLLGKISTCIPPILNFGLDLRSELGLGLWSELELRIGLELKCYLELGCGPFNQYSGGVQAEIFTSLSNSKLHC